MFDHPDSKTVLAGLAEFLAGPIKDALTDPALAFRARVAAHLASTLAAQVAQQEAAEVAALAALSQLAGQPPPGDRRAQIAALEARLAAEARQDPAPERLQALCRALRPVLAAELAVVSPRFDTSLELK